jgi:hypothetical protein
MLRPFYLGVAFVFILTTGVVHGLWTNRWNPSPALEQAAARLDRLPLDIGDWRGQDEDLNAIHVAIGEIKSYKLRRYIHKESKEIVSLLIVCGPPGPISVHTPEICYQGLGFRVQSTEDHFAVPATENSPGGDFKTAVMQKETATGIEHLRVMWTWSTGVEWTAPEHPRWKFGRERALYKVYVSRHMGQSNEKFNASDPGVMFAQELLGVLDKHLRGE